MPRVVPQVLPSFSELYPDSPEPALRLLGTLVSIRAYSPHVACLGIFLVAKLGLGAPCWLTLDVVSLC